MNLVQILKKGRTLFSVSDLNEMSSYFRSNTNYSSIVLVKRSHDEIRSYSCPLLVKRSYYDVLDAILPSHIKSTVKWRGIMSHLQGCIKEHKS